MSRLQETLQAFESASNSTITREWNADTSEIVDKILGKRRRVRDASEIEETLAFISTGEPILRLADISSNAGTIEEEILNILNVVTKLNEICKNPETESKVQDLLGIIDESYTRSRHLSKYHDQKCREIETLTTQFTEINTAANIQSMRQYEAVREAEEEEEQEVAKLQAELDKLKSYNGLLVKRENDYRRIGQDIKEKALQGSLNPELPDGNGREKMEELEREKEELVRLIANDDALLEEESIIPPKLSSSKELYNEICAEIEDLIKSPAEDGSRLSIQGLTDKLGSVMAGMNERLDRLVAIDVNEKEMSVYNQLLTFFHNRALNPDDREIDVDSEKLSEAFPHITNTTVPQLMLSDTSLRITAVLLKLYNEGPMTLQNLVTYVDDFSRNHVVSSETTQTIIYSLVAADLVVIDRRHKDSLVKLKL